MAIKNRLFKNHMESVGNTGEVDCPSCGKRVLMPVFRNYDSFNLVGLIKNEKQQMGIAVCPECAGVFTVNPDYLDAVKAGQTVFLTADDLTKAGNGEK